jgi:adenylate cyclase
MQLVDSTTGGHIWSENYDRTLDAGNIFELQDDLTDVIVGTVADGGGVLTRSMLATIRRRPVDELTADDWVFRAIGWIRQITPEEHAVVREGLERAVEQEPDHAVAWGWLAIIYVSEYQHSLNPLPDPLGRVERTARRSVDLDPTCQVGWAAVAQLSHHRFDLDGFLPAADRAISLNPRDTHFVGVMAMMIGMSGDWTRGNEITRNAMRVNPHHPGWLHFTTSYHAIWKRDFDEAMREAKRIQMPELPWSPRLMASLSGHLGDRDEAQRSLLALEQMGLSDLETTRADWAKWIPDETVFNLLIEGHEKAAALAGGDDDS